MIQRLLVLAIGCAIMALTGTELLSLPGNLSTAEHTVVSGVPDVSPTGLRAALHINADNQSLQFSTQCHIARTACEWVQNNPGIPVEAKTFVDRWPGKAWLVSMDAANGFSLGTDVQESELTDYRKRMRLGFLGTLAITAILFFRRKND